MKSRLFPDRISWEEWKDRPLPEKTWEEWDKEEDFGGVTDGLNVEFYKSECRSHSREFIEEFLYEYQSVLETEEFEYSDFPQVLSAGPDYMAWLEWVELECKSGTRFPYEAYLQIVINRRMLINERGGKTGNNWVVP